MKDILEEALELTKGDRNESYGPPYEDFERIAAIWTALKPGTQFNARDVARFMIGLKIARDVHRTKRDNAVDAAGYARCLDLCNQAAGCYNDTPPKP